MAVKQQSDRATEESIPVKTKYAWYVIRIRRNQPRSFAHLTIPAPRGWTFPITLQRQRGYYEPRGRKDHDAQERMSFTDDCRYFRLTADQHGALVERLQMRTLSAGLPTIVWETGDTLRPPDPKLAEIVELKPEAPRNWRDCRWDEYHLDLATPVVEADVDVYCVRSPDTAAAQERIDFILDALVRDCERPAAEIVAEAAQMADDAANEHRP
ncbi:MAG: hypothetical protein ABII82_20100 [Verrucomicrobiota bacterium]